LLRLSSAKIIRKNGKAKGAVGAGLIVGFRNIKRKMQSICIFSETFRNYYATLASCFASNGRDSHIVFSFLNGGSLAKSTYGAINSELTFQAAVVALSVILFVERKMLEENLELLDISGAAKKNRFVVFYKETILSVKLEHVSYFQIVDGHMFLITTDGKKYPLRKSMRELEQVLSPDTFFKVNRSEVISFDSIDKIESFFGQRVVVYLKPFGKVIVSKSRLSRFLGWLDL
jgi:hypothetical protein